MSIRQTSTAPLPSPVVPLDQLAGKWIAWDRGSRRILASGRTFAEVAEAAAAAGEMEPVFEKLPKGQRYWGSAR